MNRAPSTISREIARNGGTGHYRALEADERALQAALRPKRCFLEQNRRLRYAVERKLCREWSPEQVSGWLKNRYADDEAMRVSHETVYCGQCVAVRARHLARRADHGARVTGRPPCAGSIVCIDRRFVIPGQK
ncbi:MULTISPECIES: helix-turn-helix domain-containing protein [unclassified Burkholderia]|uniref:helix-turn-helix domain-containing protein n=1 Tax=unclassified Burkholderia TaxID=2613784 RepID=UPI0021AB6F3E|nr:MULTISPECIES: helix-turn-helix domain-containing protein [unclassified Burkholderia]